MIWSLKKKFFTLVFKSLFDLKTNSPPLGLWASSSFSGMRCPNSPIFCEIFMFRVLILWVHFLFLIFFHISCLLLIMFLDGLKLRPPELMILKLLWILWDLTFFASLVCLEPLLVNRGATSVTGHCHPYSRSVGLCIELLQLMIPKLMGKRRFLIERSSKCHKR